MGAKFKRQNFWQNPVMDPLFALTILGIEYEIEWQVAEVPATNGRVYLRVTTPSDKYTLVNFREIRHDQTFGYYRQYRIFDDSGATPEAPLTVEPMRGDTTISSGALFEPITGVVVDPANAFSKIPLWGAIGQGNKQGAGGLSDETTARVIPPGTVVLLEFENNSDAPAHWYAYFKQYEVFPSALPTPTDL